MMRTREDGALLRDYWTVEQLAAECGVSVRTLRNWKALGEAPAATRIGRKILFAASDVQAWLQRQRVAA